MTRGPRGRAPSCFKGKDGRKGGRGRVWCRGGAVEDSARCMGRRQGQGEGEGAVTRDSAEDWQRKGFRWHGW